MCFNIYFLPKKVYSKAKVVCRFREVSICQLLLTVENQI